MSDIKWVKITTDLFDNRKIKKLRMLKDGNNFVLIWIMFLTIAGRCNSNGLVFLTETIPYDTKTLAFELGFKESIIKEALSQFEKLGMIEMDGQFICIPGWEEYQNKEALDKIREQTRKRVAKHRNVTQDVTQDVTLQSVTSNVTEPLHVTQCNATEKEEERETEKEEELKKVSTRVETKEMALTPPSLDDVIQYRDKRNSAVNPERFFDYNESRGWSINGQPIKDWKAVFRNWERTEKTHPKNETEYVGPNGVKLLPPEERDTDLDMIFAGDFKNGK